MSADQQTQIVAMVEEAVRAALGGVSDDNLRRLIERKPQLEAVMKKAVREVLDRYSVHPKKRLKYPQRFSISSPGRQLWILECEAALGLSTAETYKFIEDVLPTLELPKKAEGWFVMPSVAALAARHFPGVTGKDEQYCRAVLFMMKKLQALRPFHYLIDEIAPHLLHSVPRTVSMMEQVAAKTQRGDFFFLPAQFGGSRIDVTSSGELADNEFDLGIFAGLSMLLTCPSRIRENEQLMIACLGDRFTAHETDHLPLFVYDDDQDEKGEGSGIAFSVVPLPETMYGRVTGFLV